MGLVLKFEMWTHFDQNRNQNHLLFAIVFDCMVYPVPKFLVFKAKNGLFFSEDEG